MEPTNYTATEENDILSDIGPDYQQATQKKRFAGYLIDVAGFYALQYLLAFVVVKICKTSLPLITGIVKLDVILYAYLMYFLMYFISESISKGKTLGKLIMGTRAVNIDGSSITPKQVFIRTISRFVPFEGFTGLKGDTPTMWHDSWAKTVVIDEKKGM
jgi:uncharacterized RDD family membrane protein YckC